MKRRPRPAHGLLPVLRHDERSRGEFVGALRAQLARSLTPGVRTVFERCVAPAFSAEHGRQIADFREARRVMERNDYYQFWSALQRGSQELTWSAVIEPTERVHGDLTDAFRDAAGKATAPAANRGTLRLNPALIVPRYHTAADIHLQPGGYHTEFAPDDVAAGAVYDQALGLYSNGSSGPLNEVFAERLMGFMDARVSGIAPRRVLDMGCAIGNSTLPWARRFPAAEVHGIDVAAPQLRYAHARAESLGVRAHFSQQNAEATDFRDGSFDLIVSHIMLHETSRSALPRILAECRRLLAPDGLMLHLEVPRGRSTFEKFAYNWESWNNNETFAVFLTDLDLAALAVDCGFDPLRTQCVEFSVPRPPEQRLYAEESFWKVLVSRA